MARAERAFDERGFLARAGDEVRSWFGDEEAERRRERELYLDYLEKLRREMRETAKERREEEENLAPAPSRLPEALRADLEALRNLPVMLPLTEGRIGWNVVTGYLPSAAENTQSRGQLDTFEHDARYDYAQEWLDVIKRAWTDQGDFDFAGQYLNLKGVRAFPKPFGDTRPIIMNAGRSGIGQSFALKNCDAFFTATVDSRHSVEANAKKVDEIKGAAAAIGREIDVYTVGQVVCRPTQKEADDYYRYAQVDNADWGAIEQMMALKNVTRQTVTAEVYAQQQQYYATKAIGGFPFVGTPDSVAEELSNISRAGMRGIAVSFVNYLNEVPYFCDEVLPRLARLGIRQPH